jgi:ATP-binding cassette subfamily C (CFTR/MRP) protein 1
VGVVGRTGAGKSSLIAALYRLAEISSDNITVDTMDCSTVSLKTLRQSMAIFPQEPVMFRGTLRSNVDPFNLHSTEEIVHALRNFLLEHLVDSKDGLGTHVELLGTKFSLGTQQLICLARAMFNPSRILLLDEATTALDSDTNAAFQEVLKKDFSHRTIVTIAHLLDTIIDFDRILVMYAGDVAELDSPFRKRGMKNVSSGDIFSQVETIFSQSGDNFVSPPVFVTTIPAFRVLNKFE